ncbi:MAG: peptide chain release factor N(5)-glutamine methyltransferase [Lachnospiraceae bacterium]|nr:peptide chain release factor N(5)-glutamine methyltransferase [Lachnospiraceae bacterium]
MRYSEAKKRAVSILSEAGIEEAEVDSEYLLLSVTGLDKAGLLMKLFDEMPEKEEKAYEELIGRRSSHEPLQYIIGNQNFMGYTFLVTPDVLIPRFDTEILAELAGKRAYEAAVQMYSHGKTGDISGISDEFRILDICTGSGCVPVSVGLDLYKKIRSKGLKLSISVTAADISEAAVALAEKNYKLNLEDGDQLQELGYRFIVSDLFSNIDGKYHIITANPPYIVRDEIEELMPEISEHEPRLALDGGTDGMDFYRRIVKDAGSYLVPGGRLLMEFDDSQAEPVKKMMEEAGFTEVEVHRDLAGLRRVIEGRK